jgi:perosamine synthetase
VNFWPKKQYFLGMAAGFSREARLKHTFSVGLEKDRAELVKFLEKKYGVDPRVEGEAISAKTSKKPQNAGSEQEKSSASQAMLCKNGRSALCLALEAYFNRGDKIIVNGFTCYAVVEAVKKAGLTPVFADISREDLNFNVRTLEKAITRGTNESKTADKDDNETNVRGIIIQNSLGNPVDILAIEKFARKQNLILIEDLAHAAGRKYSDGREMGTVGAATVLSFGKDKAIDTVSGGAVILRDPCKNAIEAPTKLPKLSDLLRARFYPLLGAICRGLTRIHLGGALMRGLVKIHWVEKSADNRLDLERKISKFEAKLALKQLQKSPGTAPLRDFYLVNDREKVLRELRRAGYYFYGFWYERPVSPARCYQKVHFPEEDCPEAVFVSEHIVNFPRYYSKKELEKARKIVEKYLIREKEGREK